MDGAGAGRSVRPEAVYRTVYKAVDNRRPISAAYHDRPRCSAHTGWDATARANYGCSVINLGARVRVVWVKPGSPSNWRCIALEELSKVRLLRGPWRTAPNHSRPAHCIVHVDIDADDQPERAPQNGQ